MAVRLSQSPASGGGTCATCAHATLLDRGTNPTLAECDLEPSGKIYKIRQVAYRHTCKYYTKKIK